jgi:hypothetical protein
MKRDGKTFWFVLTIMILGSFSEIAFANSKVFEFDREFYPFYPSLAKWNKSNAPFTPPEACRGCHPKQYNDWTGSVHALAFQDPIFQGELNKAVQAAGPSVARQCVGCHSPAGMVTGEIKKPGIADLSPMALAGVSCDICHSISEVTHLQTPSHEPENGSFILSPGVDSIAGVKLIKRGPFKPSGDCGKGFHECAETPVSLRAELCAGCHQVYHYDDHFPLGSTYLEWKHSAYAQKEILCQDCHMVDFDVFLSAADDFRKPERDEYRHFFNGANYLLYYLAATAAKKAGDETRAATIMYKYDMAVKRLKSAADLEISPFYQNGSISEVRVRVKNIRAGHNLPTSMTNIRQMWLDITIKDDKGNILLSSGSVDTDGRLPENARVFNSEGMGKDFHYSAEPWVVTSFSRHDTIPPKGYKDAYYGLNPSKGSKNIFVEARLRYRQADPGMVDTVLRVVPESVDLKEIYGLTKALELPIVDMVSKKVVLSATK